MRNCYLTLAFILIVEGIFAQQHLWLLMKNSLFDVKNSEFIENEQFQNMISSTSVINYKQVFPYSKNDTLLRLIEVFVLDKYVNTLASSSLIEDIFVLEEPENIELYTPNDYMWNYTYSDSTSWLWHLRNIEAEQAWDITKGDPEVTIAILDSWFDVYHPDLANKMVCNYDPYDGALFYSDGSKNNHGTTVASFAAAENDGGDGLSSIGFNCKIIPYKAHAGSYLERAHHASLAIGADVLTSSAGGWFCNNDFNDIEKIAVKEILDNGTVIVMPAGNGLNGTHCYNSERNMDQPWRPLHPHYDNRIIIVTSVDKYDYHNHLLGELDVTHSHYPDVDICAPGYGMMGATSTINSSGNLNEWPFYGDCSGTSYATPIVAGVCALIKSVNRCLTPADIEDIIKTTADPVQDANLFHEMVGAGRINAYRAVSLALNYHNNDDTIISNVVWSTNSFRGGNTIVDSGSTLTITGTLHCSPTARIIVRPGGRLVVDGGVLTSACEDGMWEGIYVEGDRTRPQTVANQGTVELKNGAVIENAHCGITTSSPDEQWLSTGGIILADSASFRNCRRAVAFLSYADTIGQNDIRANQSRFNKCSFSVDDDNHFSANGTSFYAHASLWDVNGVRFDGCTFTNTMTGRYANSGRAIYSEDAGFSVKTLCGAPDNLNIPCECPATYATYSSAGGFSTAVETNTTGSQYGITLDEVRFSNNARAVAVNGNNHATVTRCEFNLQNMPGSVGITKGLVLNNCTGYLVEGNDFSGNLLADGIVVNNSGTDNNSIYRNSFSNLHYGANVQGGNGTMQKVSTGLVFSCNDFTNDNYDIYLNQNSTMRLNQGNAGLGADNCFSGSRISSLYAEPLGYSYYYSTGVCHQPRSAHNFTLHSGAQANGCASTLCAGITPGTGPGLPTRSSEGEYAMLKNRYDSLLTVFEARGFADVLTDADANPVVEDSRVASAKRMQAELASLGETLHRMAHAAVRGLKNDTVTDLVSLADWYAATPGLSSRYAEHELAPSAILAAAIADNLSTAEERDEYDNYSLFVSTRRANWPASTESDIEMLRRIAERNTGRSSEMAKGVLCFFFDECVEEETGANTSDTRSVRAVGEEAGNELSVYPNPSSDKLSVYSSRLAISSLQLFDAFGKLLLTRSVNDGECELDLTAVPAGLYLLKAELEDGSIEVLKVVKK